MLNAFLTSRHAKVNLLVLIFILLSIPSPAFCSGEFPGHIDILLGKKQLDKDKWRSIENPIEFGLNLDFRKKHWPVNMIFGILYSQKSNTIYSYSYNRRVEGQIIEFHQGLRKYFKVSDAFHPFFELGLAVIHTLIEKKDTPILITPENLPTVYLPDEDIDVGLFCGAGIRFIIGDVFNIGVGLKYSVGSNKFYDETSDGGGIHVLGFVGYQW